MSKVLSVLVLSLAVTSAANAFERTPPWAQHQAANHQTSRDASRANASDPAADPPAAAPEIDPGSAMSALTLLAGALVMVRGRRSRKSKEE
jgi:hypothetical protein